VLPEHFVKVFRDLTDGRREDALVTWNQLSPWIPLLFDEPNPVPLKAWLAEQGLISSPECRLPLVPATSALLAAIRERLPAN
jgi:4-hydroxy-tetrahydrodipicolinate synthase